MQLSSSDRLIFFILTKAAALCNLAPEISPGRSTILSGKI
jgi:hypothetical protein